MPTEPDPVDLSVFTDKDARNVAEREQKRIIQVYQQALKDWESAIKDGERFVEKHEKQLKAEEKQRLKKRRGSRD